MLVISAINDNEKKNAGPKAPKDINNILKQKYNAKIIKIHKTKFYKIKILFVLLLSFMSKEIIVIQHPLLYNYFLLKLIPRYRKIIIIHDISGLRNQDEMLIKKEINIFKDSKYIIVHNSKMKEYLIKKGINEKNMICLEAFDYLTKDNDKCENKELNENNKSIEIIYPGNLKKEKSPFIYQLDENKMNFILNLYGIGINKSINSKIIYKGSFEPDEISDIEGDLGLIWDGNYDESDEDKKFKNYTKYNNPHKLSCILAMGKPVIVWEKSAIADFVKQENIGYLIHNVYDINSLDFFDYTEKKKNAILIGEKIRKGQFTIRAFEKILIGKK